jgi:glucose/arabinose dehydrogenase
MRLPILLSVISISVCSLQSATYPSGFSEAQVVNGLSNPTSMAFAPDGRLFVCEQGGNLRIVKNGSLLAAPFLTVTVNSLGERGLLGVAFDPNFTSNGYVYIYYTATAPLIHNRVSRFIASGDTAAPGSETVLLDLENLSSATNHNGGAIHFGLDGKLYVSVGENANSANSQSLSTRLGKMLRINSDGTIPFDNPFAGASGLNQAIWAMGLRNPFTFAVQPGSGRIFINDVGENTWEEINDGITGSNYGWPATEGIKNNPAYRDPIFAYGHGSGSTLGCAITGGTFYNPTASQYPGGYTGVYFFSDYCSGWIRKLDPASGNTVSGFATAISSAVDLKVGDDGLIYYLTRGSGGAVYKILYSAASQAPSISVQPISQTRPAGQPVTFTVGAGGTAPLSYQWQRNMISISGATSASYTIAAVAAGDNGAQFRCVVTNTAGSATSNSATLTVTTSNTAPTPVISTPIPGTTYTGGMTINYSGTGNDKEDGALPASAFTWKVDFHHDTHVHPFIAATTGAASGFFIIPNSGEVSANVWYRIYLTVTDSGGLTTTVYRDVLPRKVDITLAATNGVTQLTLDGQPVKVPYVFTGVVGITRSIGAVSTQRIKGKNYGFVSWSDGGAQTHSILTPSVNTTYTATYVRSK